VGALYMDRRAFLKSLFAIGAAAATVDIEKILTECEEMSDEKFLAYVTYTMNLYISNPRSSVNITGITE
jgi:hypothetical protein